jgi:hypothetical protein
MQTHIHPFEAANLGKAPFRFQGVNAKVFHAFPGAPPKPGSSCDYCGTGITNEFWCLSADGKRFKVGCDCIRKVSSKGERLLNDAEKAQKTLKRQQRADKVMAYRQALGRRCTAACEALQADASLFCDEPHPNAHFASNGKLFRDYLFWCLTSCYSDDLRELACAKIDGALGARQPGISHPG